MDGHTVVGAVADGTEVLDRLNTFPVEKDTFRSLANIRILGTMVLDDPFPETEEDFEEPKSVDLQSTHDGHVDFDQLLKQLPGTASDGHSTVRSGTEAEPLDLLKVTEDQLRRRIKRYQRNTNELVLEMLNDLPQKGVKPPSNVLFVCKLNRLTREE